MRWTPGGLSRNVEDRRGMGGGFGGGGMKLGLGGLLIAGILTLLTGQDFFSILGGFAGDGAPDAQSEGTRTRTPGEDRMAEFVSFVLDDAQNTWQQLLPQRYQDAKLVLFTGAVRSACGFAQAATGPFYCPADQKVYIDLSFYEELSRRFGAPGDFAQAYVLAHEVGHHVQNLLGIERRFRQEQQMNPGMRNRLSVAMELQADCLAGVWGHSAAQRDRLETGDVEEGLRAASAIGDDRLQRMGQGYVSPETFTHGSSEQRAQWFRRGLESGQITACDTFKYLQ